MTRYRRHPELRLTALEGDGVVLHLGTRRYFSVSETGLVLLEALETARTADELTRTLSDRYSVIPEHAAASVHTFLERCHALEMVLVEREP
jgi:Coenzyme PQQ synthesis protein D (PqqD)